MSLSAPQLSPTEGAPFKVAIAAACYNGRLVDGLLERVTAALGRSGVKPRNLTVVRVPGSNEVPLAVRLLARRRPDAIIALGVVVRGDTIHYELIASAVAHGLQEISLATERPVINGVIVAESAAQAEERCLGRIDRGAEFAEAALTMAALRRRFIR
ncbi:MAG: 6,7-dimethyl-8-ribityllumazine synthase [Opitutaceae bacterium]